MSFYLKCGGEKNMQEYFEKWDASTFAFPTAGTGDLIGHTHWGATETSPAKG